MWQPVLHKTVANPTCNRGDDRTAKQFIEKNVFMSVSMVTILLVKVMSVHIPTELLLHAILWAHTSNCNTI